MYSAAALVPRKYVKGRGEGEESQRSEVSGQTPWPWPLVQEVTSPDLCLSLEGIGIALVVVQISNFSYFPARRQVSGSPPCSNMCKAPTYIEELYTFPRRLQHRFLSVAVLILIPHPMQFAIYNLPAFHVFLYIHIHSMYMRVLWQIALSRRTDRASSLSISRQCRQLLFMPLTFLLVTVDVNSRTYICKWTYCYCVLRPVSQLKLSLALGQLALAQQQKAQFLSVKGLILQQARISMP